MKLNPLKKIGFLLINQYGGRGGVEKVLIHITKALDEKGIQSYLLYTDTPIDPTFLNNFKNLHLIKKITDSPKKSFLPKFISRIIWKKLSQKCIKDQFKNIIDPLKLDAMIIVNMPTNYVSFNKTINVCKEQSNIKFFSWLHGSLYHLKPNEINYIKKSLNIYDGHLAICEGIKEQLANLLNISSEVIYNPVQDAELVKRDPNKLLYIGRIDANKRVHNILHMLTKIQGSWSLDIIGSTGSVQEDNNFTSYIKKLGLSQKVTFHGWVENPWEKVDSAGLLLLNSSNEGFGLVLAEAMMRGIPCLSSNCPVGPNEIIKNNINGWLYPVNNEKLGASILQDIISGKRVLPSPQIVKNSVQKFQINHITNNFIMEIQKKQALIIK